MHFVGLFFSSIMKMHGPKNKITVILLRLIIIGAGKRGAQGSGGEA